jgi:hypothetical protein
MNLKTLYRSNKEGLKAHRDITDSAEYKQMVASCFAVYCSQLPGGDSPAKAWDANSRRQGAWEFINLLEDIAQQEKPQPKSAIGLKYGS